jgi:predicted aminopeptidase
VGFLKKKKLLNFFLSATLLLVASCAKFDYLYEQGVGQISLLSKGKDNQEMLKSVRIPKNQKEKIQKIQELKKYFYRYWDKKETKIYSQTTMLKNRAVTYLVIASPYQEIKAEENCFPLMGCFPYLGFFSLTSAKKFAKEREADGLVTWTRPVYAYSTLGYFTDTILSSFFEYDDYELAELIFHELFHTIFFVKNQVDLNENLAMYFSEHMLEGYFTSVGQVEYLKFEMKKEVDEKKLKHQVVLLANELQELYKNLLPKNKVEGEQILNEFIEGRFKVEIMKKCQELDIQPKDCFPLDRKWNNASFAAFLTYEKSSNDLASLQKKLGLDLKGYYNWIAKKYEAFQAQSEEDDFETYLFK